MNGKCCRCEPGVPNKAQAGSPVSGGIIPRPPTYPLGTVTTSGAVDPRAPGPKSIKGKDPGAKGPNEALGLRAQMNQRKDPRTQGPNEVREEP